MSVLRRKKVLVLPAEQARALVLAKASNHLEDEEMSDVWNHQLDDQLRAALLNPERSYEEWIELGAWEGSRAPLVDNNGMLTPFGFRVAVYGLKQQLLAQKGSQEAMAGIIEKLLDELRSRGVTPELDLTAYDEFRSCTPKEDA